jgi:hypothetical protein
MPTEALTDMGAAGGKSCQRLSEPKEWDLGEAGTGAGRLGGRGLPCCCCCPCRGPGGGVMGNDHVCG